MDLPNEMLFEILIRLRYVDVQTLPFVSKRLHKLCLSYQKYRERLLILKQILGDNCNKKF